MLTPHTTKALTRVSRRTCPPSHRLDPLGYVVWCGAHGRPLAYDMGPVLTSVYLEFANVHA